ncbi:nucleoside transporter-domain-containing protein [Melanogaster broomeanus]|nr:nucleoside transporter-domain-containing protein [Melanogaster broomeanus]
MTPTTHPGVEYRPLPSSEEDHEVGADQLHLLDESTPSDVVVDTRIRWIYFMLGCAILLPWNALINGTSFFLSRLVGSPLSPTFSSYQSSVFTLSNLIAQTYCTITSKQSSPSRRTSVSITAMLLFVALLCFSTFVQATPTLFFSFVLLSSVCLAVSAGYLGTAVYAGAALFGTSYLQTVISGQAAVAVAVSAVQVASSAISVWGSTPSSIAAFVASGGAEDDQAEGIAARIFFGVSTVFLAFTLVAYTWLTRQPAYRSTAGLLEQHRKAGDEDSEELCGLMDGGVPSSPNVHVLRVLKENFIFMFSISYVFVVTLAVFPAITVTVRPTNSNVHPMLFTAVHFLTFNVGDLVGRYSCSFSRLIVWSANKILAMSLLRTLFIPLLLLCNVQRPAGTLPAPPIISSDILFMLILLAMGYTNGYVSSLGMLAASSLEHNPRLKGRREDVDVAATVGGSFIMAGLAVGAFLSFGVRAAICDCNPFKA